MAERIARALLVLRERASSARGIAVPTVLMMIFAATAVAGVAITSSIRAGQGTTRDADLKSALPAAEAGVAQALLHYNRVPTTETAPCIVSDGGQVDLQAADASGWCAPSAGTLDGKTFSYQVMPTDGALNIVSTGVSDGITRRIAVTAASSSGQQMFRNATVLMKDFIDLDSNAQFLTSVATNGDIHMDSNARICGGSSVGIGRHMTANSNAAWYDDFVAPSCITPRNPGDVPQAPLVLPDVNPGDAWDVNDNGRFFGLDHISGTASKVCWNGLMGNGTAGTCGPRELDMASNTTLTLSGNVYSFCSLHMSSNTNLVVTAGSNTAIYFAAPEDCHYDDNKVQLKLESNARITATSGGPTNVAMYFVGSDSQNTRIELDSNTQVAGDCEQNFVIYAPRSTINMHSNSTYCGALAGKSLHADSNAKIYADNASRNFFLPEANPHYNAGSFIECVGPAATPPNAGC